MFSTSIGGYILIATIYMLNFTFVKPDCRSVLLSQCGVHEVNSVQNYLDNPFPSNVNLDVRCNSPPVLVGWSLSSNGTEPDAKLIDTSLPKYTQNGNTLRIDGVNASDEGLYRCVYSTGKVPRLCILVHARAAFASCPSSSGGCSDPENITVTVGESINFNASIVFIGGNCGFKQVIERNILKRCLNNNCTTESSPLIVPQNPESDLLTLPNSSLEDSGLYQVIVVGRHPNGSGSTSIEKLYWVTVNAPTTTTTAEEQETTTSTVEEWTTTVTGASSGSAPTTLVAEEVTTNATSKPLSNASQSTTATNTIFDAENPQSDGSPTMIIVIIFSIILALVVTSLVAIIIVVCTKRKHTNRKGSVAIHAPNTDLHLENGLDGRDNPLGAEHSSEGTDHSSEGGSSTASLIGENANDVQSSTEQEENERREPESDACEVGSTALPRSMSEGQGVIINPMTMCASIISSREPPERSDVSSQISNEDNSSPKHAHPVDDSAHVQQSLSGSQQGSGHLTEGSSSTASLIDADATVAHSSNELGENEQALGHALPHSSSTQEDLEVFTNHASQEPSTRSDASSLTSTEEDSPMRQSACPCGSSGHMPQPQESHSVGKPLNQEQRIKLIEGFKPLELRPEIPDLMNKVAAKILAKWVALGIQLGIEADQLEAWDAEHRGKSNRIYLEIFNSWMKKSGGKPKTWLTVIDALKTPSVDEVALARDLELSMTPSSCASTNTLASSRSWEQTHSMA